MSELLCQRSFVVAVASPSGSPGVTLEKDTAAPPANPSRTLSQKSTLGERNQENETGPEPCQDAGLARAVAGPCPSQP